jgi:hypothetical protein
MGRQHYHKQEGFARTRRGITRVQHDRANNHKQAATPPTMAKAFCWIIRYSMNSVENLSRRATSFCFLSEVIKRRSMFVASLNNRAEAT